MLDDALANFDDVRAARAVALLRREAPDCRVVVGGAVLTPELAAAIGAHAYARDAMDTVRFARENA